MEYYKYTMTYSDKADILRLILYIILFYLSFNFIYYYDVDHKRCSIESKAFQEQFIEDNYRSKFIGDNSLNPQNIYKSLVKNCNPAYCDKNTWVNRIGNHTNLINPVIENTTEYKPLNIQPNEVLSPFTTQSGCCLVDPTILQYIYNRGGNA